MKLELLVICDYATFAEGKLSLIGIFDRVAMASLPGRLITLGIGIRVSLTKAEAMQVHTFKLRLVSPTGKELVRAEGTASVMNSTAFLEEEDRMQIGLTLPGVTLPEIGRHELEVLVDGKGIGSIPLTVRLLPASPG